MFELGPIETNSYVLYTKEKTACIVDPVQVCRGMTQFIETEGLEVRSIVATHSHADHVHAAALFARQFNVPVRMHAAAEELREFYRDSCFLLGFEPNELITDYKKIDEGDTLSLGNETMKVMHTPGHSHCSISLVADDLVVTGDVLFQGSVGRYDLPGGSFNLLCGSLQRLCALDERLVVLPGHGPVTDIGTQKYDNAFISSI
ncbi:MAG: hypothetical protein A2268_10510 [Candidatus Raymondbacteria bacterium RifOxyA12_full_50_37]|uniref:Metallo-beta-lactamase domain-containing protein n=1 Tax=Candidatus Raymondbacteria bacterium RIFOXYD12_FULL_49_13 TaxID=1817890 RepID=A0A1F7F914_UNCRA|nr:MAG: hypothetical protein A2268_10510 [Candidatus Raymondbacteria bacterium RifOxyA12_full_50_37]OGJ85396.1 MAG: hypothetical protein A2248_12295 [Candidatus Raymondbacteria bacterium RIFOXYA2_FULL_49_16]OGJ94904.1 MAG: hypothetical protein A2453_07765 [Candidatus Raymondbacteria bacterium RIFOXYC2_FULL_50_21]OGK00002.1 MAG: hypothetical protein A2487_11670 [Candidatus Raymondbacteria bacterium RifOxyC12_full_50_8]OGK01234.1 MAG: hypothetical protein A2350_11465 [Candidatus Raymondbacteria b